MKSAEEMLSIIAVMIDNARVEIDNLDSKQLSELSDEDLWNYHFYQMSLGIYEALLVDFCSTPKDENNLEH